jgi:WD40 repeat protein
MQTFSSGSIFNNEINTIINVRKFSNKPYKIVEAPGLLDDFYLNLLDWSNKNDVAVGLDNSLCLYSTSKNQMFNLFSYDSDKYVSSLIWNSEGTEIAVGNSEGLIEIWDGKIIFIILFFS